jgi:hypothetical protein
MSIIVIIVKNSGNPSKNALTQNTLENHWNFFIPWKTLENINDAKDNVKCTQKCLPRMITGSA